MAPFLLLGQRIDFQFGHGTYHYLHQVLKSCKSSALMLTISIANISPSLRAEEATQSGRVGHRFNLVIPILILILLIQSGSYRFLFPIFLLSKAIAVL